MCSLILLCLFSLYTNDLLKYKNRVIENILRINLVSFMKKNFIDKEKSGTVTKVELLTKILKAYIQQLYVGTLALASHCYCGDSA